MTIRITPAETPGHRVLKIDGRLQGPDLPELERLCTEGPEALTLDLSGLRGVDEPAIIALRRLRAQGARLIGVSAYVALRLEGTTR
ncbi:hypothetical protein G3480_17780 [Thiorhodococcus mannitoliphagus]|uniref:STAS domain-containing protein n=1 Tax=Thiorhodococcus mannitoliphagus TaxID=329406 RepID=A0A6P1DYH1_9GAMM|nr:hypothetical protein [Thiorhodococcus mannitoliphagus]NEX22133.1 hypothetical protein [Thiorhodococcus mannitoliphagus]